ncbi:sigma-70 family RNA polymerase sigma factor [Paucibacter sp. R3-3]|uniref:Sigma-70 family RNA polymerase sigma factor n=1 Tax=Roseateles agri TaxID=3098619 RepID=A0ABU5DG02_9BURK|nr:sigma-70 family RNA polymerase sigma factor [Paucibacter sp. R3-3]MDY0745210.1 sigma-70 family RNA polymerase sigma factor [Paucibacter sp. R3-3]
MTENQRFETVVLPHLDAAHNLARWLLRDTAAAEDATQEAALRAFRYFGGLRSGEDPKPWFLAIVRNCCFTALARRRPELRGLDEEDWDDPPDTAPQPPQALSAQRERDAVDAALRSLSPALREVIVLRELEDLDYRAIAQIAGVPIGTVMSRLSRARARMKQLLSLAGLP